MEEIKLGAVYSVGARILLLAQSCGEVVALMRRTMQWFLRAPLDRRNVLMQMAEMGARSFSVTSLTLLFTGMVLALQSGFSFIKVFNEPLYIGRVVGVSIIKELGPVLTALVFSGRIGAAIAAEIGTMKVTEQVDALYTLGTNPVKYLAVPRFIAAITMLPILTIYSNFIGVVGGYIVANFRFQIPGVVYWDEIYSMQISEVSHGLIKSLAFSLIIVTTACYKGFKTSGGAEGVGRATTSAVVTSMVLVLIGDYFLTALLTALHIG